ncbi:MAG: GMC family oxidoreductase [Myxococcales bacterium]|nr:GMC family oxidoreductase [Myxococcales bacterium]
MQLGTTEQATRDTPFSAREQAIVTAIAAAAMPAHGGLEGGGPATLARLTHFLRDTPRDFADGIRALLWMVELAPLPTRARRFTSLSRDDAESFLDAWVNGRLHLQRSALRALLTPIKYAHFDAPHMFEHVGCRYRVDTVRDEQPRWLGQVVDGRTEGDARDETLELEAEVVVVGTGAGGAAAAYALARRGHAVLLLEEGDYHRRGSFTGRAPDMTKLLYRDMGLTVALGNAGIPVFAGRAVGGSTVINSGTCYRLSERVFTRWRSRYGLGELSSGSMDPYYSEVEEMLGVAPAEFSLTGGVGRVVERGARKLGLLHHKPLSRNAPGCDGQGICCFGCPTGAKRSTDVSYVPAALERGAQLVTAAKVEAVEVVAGRARGVRGTLGSGRKFKVKAAAVVVAGGTLCTPGLLQRSGLSHPMIGKNLSIHPATKVCALFDEVVDQSRGIPQGYCVEDMADQGIMLEGGSTPLDVMSMGVPFVGRRYMDVMADFPHLATFGLMVQDTARGAVRTVGKRLLITYDMNAHDLERMRRGVVEVCKIFRAAGARRVLPFVAGRHEIRDDADLEALATRPLRAGDVEITAYHPLGTARIGTDPERSVCGPDHETHECAGLYVMDGAALPSSLGVNPQMTIMAMALRASERLSATL